MKIAIVTGASSGLGREFVKELAAEKKYEEIWVIARRKEELLSLAQSGVRLHVLPLDLTLEESFKWWGLFLILCISLFIALPSRMRTKTVFGKLVYFPRLALKMIKNILHLDKNNKEFFHTTHGK